MPDAIDTKPTTAQPTRADIIKAFYDAPDKKTKAAVVAKYPELKNIFSEGEYTN